MKTKQIITICGSMQFLPEMKSLQKDLESKGIKVFIPQEEPKLNTPSLSTQALIDQKQAFIDHHIDNIRQSTAVLIANYAKKEKENYIGSNTFLEMACAYVLEKKIFLLNNIPNQNNSLEIQALKPVCLAGNISQLFYYL